MINSLHRDKYGSLPVCTEIFSFDFAGKSYPPFIEYALTHNQHVCPIFVHSHEEPELIHVLNGELDITTDGRRARLRKGETALISPHTAHGADFVPGCDFLEYCYLIFALGILSGCGKKTADEITALRQGAVLFPDKLTGTLSEKVGRNMLAVERLLFRQPVTAAGELEACACLSNIMSAILTEGLIHRGARQQLHRACRTIHRYPFQGTPLNVGHKRRARIQPQLFLQTLPEQLRHYVYKVPERIPRSPRR